MWVSKYALASSNGHFGKKIELSTDGSLSVRGAGPVSFHPIQSLTFDTTMYV